MFVHEIVHLPEKKFVAFRVVWNLLCGIPFLVPSFTYYTHLDHHRRKTFGTKHDGEYLPLSPPVAVVDPGFPGSRAVGAAAGGDSVWHYHAAHLVRSIAAAVHSTSGRRRS